MKISWGAFSNEGDALLRTEDKRQRERQRRALSQTGASPRDRWHECVGGRIGMDVDRGALVWSWGRDGIGAMPRAGMRPGRWP